MPPQFDSAAVNVAFQSTLSVTVGNNANRVLYVLVDTDTAPPTSVTRDGQSFTEIYLDLWRLIAPNVGTADIVVNGTFTDIYSYTALSLYNVDQVTPERTTVQEQNTFTGPWTFSVTSAIDDLVFDMGTVIGSAFSPTESGQTERIDTQLLAPANAYRALCSTRISTGTSTAMSWTGTGISAGFMYLLAVRPAASNTQTIRPDSTVSNTGWTASTTTLWQDTSDQSDATYMSATTDGSVAVLGLANPSPAFSSIAGVVVTVRIARQF
jgi:hypothetical protein